MTPWDRCEKGHDLTQPDGYIYLASRERRCRECHYASLPKSRQPKQKKDATRAVFNP